MTDLSATERRDCPVPPYRVLGYKFVGPPPQEPCWYEWSPYFKQFYDTYYEQKEGDHFIDMHHGWKHPSEMLIAEHELNDFQALEIIRAARDSKVGR